MTRIELPFPVPLSACFTNVRGRGRVPTSRYLAWQNEALWSIKAQKPARHAGEVAVYVRLVAPDKRHRDAGNTDKAVCDILVKAGVLPDDSNRHIRRLTYEWAPDGPPCLVTITNIEAEAA